MSVQAYLDAVGTKTGPTPRQLVAIAQERGLIQKGPRIDPKHVGTSGSHRDGSEVMRLDGAASKPARGPLET